MRLPVLLVLILNFCCAGSLQNTASAPSLYQPQALAMSQAQAAPGSTPLEMMSSTVQIHVDIDATLFQEDEETQQTTAKPIKDGWVGSGVVYAKENGRSLILSANHVMQTPEIGSIEEMTINFLGLKIPLGTKRIDAVKVTLTTFQGQTCNVRALVLGVDDDRDTATAVADCDAGRVAKIGRSTPARGEKIFVSGHSLGVPLAMLTEGYVSGFWRIDELGNFLLVSASAAGGNSGGPVFYNGEVIGLLVRGAPRYPHISLVTPLESVLLRIAETGPLSEIE